MNSGRGRLHHGGRGRLHHPVKYVIEPITIGYTIILSEQAACLILCVAVSFSLSSHSARAEVGSRQPLTSRPSVLSVKPRLCGHSPAVPRIVEHEVACDARSSSCCQKATCIFFAFSLWLGPLLIRKPSAYRRRGGDGWAFIPYVVDVLSPILQRNFDIMR